MNALWKTVATVVVKCDIFYGEEVFFSVVLHNDVSAFSPRFISTIKENLNLVHSNFLLFVFIKMFNWLNFISNISKTINFLIKIVVSKFLIH